MDYLLETGVTQQTIFDGAKILKMTIQSGLAMTVLDSLNFLPMRLSKLADAFGLNTSKGDFPHFFNRDENWNYVGPCPPLEMYGIDAMSTSARTKFLTWYETYRHQIFDFQNEMLYYCRNDVTF